jgi:hypothetical protein
MNSEIRQIASRIKEQNYKRKKRGIMRPKLGMRHRRQWGIHSRVMAT